MELRCQIRRRAGLEPGPVKVLVRRVAHRMGVTVLDPPGTVDAGYRGETRVNLVDHDPVRTARLARGDRIAQLVTDLPDSSRGARRSWLDRRLQSPFSRRHGGCGQ